MILCDLDSHSVSSVRDVGFELLLSRSLTEGQTVPEASLVEKGLLAAVGCLVDRDAFRLALLAVG